MSNNSLPQSNLLRSVSSVCLITALKFLMLIISPAALISGLVLAPLWVAVLLSFLTLAKIDKRKLYDACNLPTAVMWLLSWGLISSYWSLKPITSITIAIKVFLLLISVRLILASSANYQTLWPRLVKFLLLGWGIALAFFAIEVLFDGPIYSFWHHFFQPGHTQFYLYTLDRGIIFFTLTSWMLVGYMHMHNRPFSAWLIYIATGIALFFSHSTAGLIGWMLASFAYAMTMFFRSYFQVLMRYVTIFTIIIVPFLALWQNPTEILTEYPQIATSHYHRLVIWKFVATKALEKPLIGYGLASSKFIPLTTEDHVAYNDTFLSPLPLHPHNNILQIWVELGIIGLIVFACGLWWFLLHLEKISNPQPPAWTAMAYALYSQYFFVGFVAFNLWQSWWLCAAMWCFLITKLMMESKHATGNSNL